MGPSPLNTSVEMEEPLPIVWSHRPINTASLLTVTLISAEPVLNLRRNCSLIPRPQNDSDYLRPIAVLYSKVILTSLFVNCNPILMLFSKITAQLPSLNRSRMPDTEILL